MMDDHCTQHVKNPIFCKESAKNALSLRPLNRLMQTWGVEPRAVWSGVGLQSTA